MDNKITKAAAGGVASDAGSATAEELELINTYTRRTLTAGEVYVFTVVLCDNDVDRDGERFTVESLFALEKLFVGKTGIFDHNPSAKNQTARIISCKVENVASRTTATGDEYFCLKARAYLPRTEGNSELIAALDAASAARISACARTERAKPTAESSAAASLQSLTTHMNGALLRFPLRRTRA